MPGASNAWSHLCALRSGSSAMPLLSRRITRSVDMRARIAFGAREAAGGGGPAATSGRRPRCFTISVNLRAEIASGSTLPQTKETKHREYDYHGSYKPDDIHGDSYRERWQTDKTDGQKAAIFRLSAFGGVSPTSVLDFAISVPKVSVPKGYLRLLAWRGGFQPSARTQGPTFAELVVMTHDARRGAPQGTMPWRSGQSNLRTQASAG